MSPRLPDYFARPESEEEAVLRRVKGVWRRRMIAAHLEKAPIASIPEPWKQHDLPESLKAALQAEHPQARGGEDLPDLLPGEVEIARLTLVNSIHGEVTSLRARRGVAEDQIELRMVDEYETEFSLKRSLVAGPLKAEEILDLFWSAEPSPVETSCRFRFSSPFYPDLNRLATRFRA
jgi:hypothetical protein